MPDFLQKKAVLFDLDGTVLDSQEGIRNSLRYAFQELGMAVPPEEVLHQFFGPSLAFTFRRIFAFDDKTCDRAVTLYRKYYEEEGGLFECTPYPGIPALLERLRSQDKCVALATKKPERMAVRILNGLKLGGLFDEICGSTPEDQSEHKSHVLHSAIERLGTDKSTAVMVGDMSYDCIAANEVGIDCIGVLYGYGDEKNLNECPPQAVVRNTAELTRLLCGE